MPRKFHFKVGFGLCLMPRFDCRQRLRYLLRYAQLLLFIKYTYIRWACVCVCECVCSNLLVSWNMKLLCYLLIKLHKLRARERQRDRESLNATQHTRQPGTAITQLSGTVVLAFMMCLPAVSQLSWLFWLSYRAECAKNGNRLPGAWRFYSSY